MLEGPAHQPQVVEISTVVLNECEDLNDSVGDQCWKISSPTASCGNCNCIPNECDDSNDSVSEGPMLEGSAPQP
jgi:hypothetical protein